MESQTIEKVEAFPLEVPLKSLDTPPESLPYYQELKAVVFGSYKSVIVKLTTDAGTVGYGESMSRLSPQATASLIIDILRPVILGKDPFDYEKNWEEMYSTMRQRGHGKGYMVEAISGVDIATWDLMGKIVHKPIYKLLGGAFRDTIQSYASSVRFKKPEEVVSEVKSIVEEGFGQVKLKIGRGIEEDMRAVSLLRKEFGDELTIMVDANSGYNVNQAIRLGRMLEKYDVEWFEEPIMPDNLPGYSKISNSLDIPIAAGESEFTRYGFRDLITIGNVDIIQPNVGRAGGITEVKKIIDFASAYGIPYAPHTGSSSGVTMAAEIQLAVASSNFLTYEYMRTAWSQEQPNPLKTDLLKQNIDTPIGGFISRPEGEGLCVDLNEEIINKYLITNKV
ncbi:MAG: mandelate racemase/muconate lactonizing enzyme family protein [Nitrososphaerota archaeon]